MYNGIALDEFVFELEKGGDSVATVVTIPALGLTMQRKRNTGCVQRTSSPPSYSMP